MRTLSEIKAEAKKQMSICRMCKVCNGEACRGETPGPGGKGSGSTFVRNVNKWKEIQIHLDAIHEDYEVQTEVSFFGKTLRAPIFPAPIGAVIMNYGSAMDEEEYCNSLAAGCKEAGLLPFFGDGAAAKVFDAPVQAMEQVHGAGVFTIKPWAAEVAKQKVERALAANPAAIAMDVDASGLVHLKHTPTPITFKTAADLQEIRSWIPCPFIIKGIMTVEGAQKALEAGADAIVISNHGGRVLDDALSSAEVLEKIAGFVNKRMKIFVDGGIRSGADVFKALALGADGVLIGRPFSHAVFGGGSEGVQVYASHIIEELKEVMRLSDCRDIAAISRNKVKTLEK